MHPLSKETTLSFTAAINILDWTLFLVWAVLCVLRGGIVTATKQRFIVTTLLIVFTVLEIVVMSVRAVIYIIQKDFIGASLLVTSTVMFIWFLTLIMHDDNWFNDQWKRLKKGIKNLQESLQSAFMPTPAPG